MQLNITQLPVSEINYADTMKSNVEPYLASICEDNYFNSFEKNPLRKIYHSAKHGKRRYSPRLYGECRKVP